MDRDNPNLADALYYDAATLAISYLIDNAEREPAPSQEPHASVRFADRSALQRSKRRAAGGRG